MKACTVYVMAEACLCRNYEFTDHRPKGERWVDWLLSHRHTVTRIIICFNKSLNNNNNNNNAIQTIIIMTYIT